MGIRSSNHHRYTLRGTMSFSVVGNRGSEKVRNLTYIRGRARELTGSVWLHSPRLPRGHCGTVVCTWQVFNKRCHPAGYKAMPCGPCHLGNREGRRSSIHLLSSAMLPTRVASKDCSMVLSSDWLNMGRSPGLLDRCVSL